jgi:hypothetical protein
MVWEPDGRGICGTADSVQIDHSTIGSRAFASGDAGHLSVSTPLLTMDGGRIQATGLQGSRGNAGSLEARVGRLMLTGGAQIDTSTLGSGRGGDLSVVATEATSLTGRGSLLPQTGLFSVANASGDAGRLFVSAPLLNIVGGRIQARTLGVVMRATSRYGRGG